LGKKSEEGDEKKGEMVNDKETKKKEKRTSEVK
jgi:hypothetical protein